MPTPVPWPAALDYALRMERQPDRGGPTDSRVGLNQVSLLAGEYGKLILLLFRTTHIHCELYDASHCPAGSVCMYACSSVKLDGVYEKFGRGTGCSFFIRLNAYYESYL
ncbi:hypothetical protein CEXT_262321 [Caerostris extrusa]|uniref:Uncharacterized protein n=1 Tax=Caerostris extrusa TaxID=172846 RepID=A0AAV4QKN4_CAEEX|nr:hypothetical protein CEXT_262321 [Caerostris extrusa]